MHLDNNHQAFFALLRAGLWEQGVRLQPYGNIDFQALYDLADEQSVVGLIAAGLEHVEDRKVVKAEALPFLKKVYALEQRNKSMDAFIGSMVEKMRTAGIRTLLVKGQGIAQCYARPQWRSSGDVDFFLDAENYEKAKALLTQMAVSVEQEDENRLHLGMTIDSWVVELHGTMHTDISPRMDRGIDAVQADIFSNGAVRIWQDGEVEVPLPSPVNDAIIVFTHFLKHFYVGGIGLRQICDWCRLLWIYRTEIDRNLLEQRLDGMGVMTEWKAFASFAVDYLGMSAEAMPFYSPSAWMSRKARRLCGVVLDTGNFGHNKDNSYRSRYPKIVGNCITFFRRLGEFVRLSTIFPGNALKFFVIYVCGRVKATV